LQTIENLDDRHEFFPDKLIVGRRTAVWRQLHGRSSGRQKFPESLAAGGIAFSEGPNPLSTSECCRNSSYASAIWYFPMLTLIANSQ
jgi:hypothetical protein